MTLPKKANVVESKGFFYNVYIFLTTLIFDLFKKITFIKSWAGSVFSLKKTQPRCFLKYFLITLRQYTALISILYRRSLTLQSQVLAV